jgi:glycosyltransferase involved in cell wall biosynthesis
MRLLWVGVEWVRKGGDIAAGIAGELHRRGIAVELHIAGLTPADEISALPFVRAHGFLDARTQKPQIEELFLSSFALLLPSRAENTSVVIADAASFALPCFASDTGGMRTMLHDGVNGEVLPADAPVSAYADALLNYWTNSSAYLHLARSSRRRFETELSWDVAIRKLTDLLVSVAARSPEEGTVE